MINKKNVKSKVNKLIDFFSTRIRRTKAGAYFHDRLIKNAMAQSETLIHQGTMLTFSVANQLNKYRFDSFATKEPETLEWIDKIPQGSVIWDIGANIGLYACYAAKHRNCRVFAFEPSVFNLESLARNVFLNELTELVTIVPLPLTEALNFSTLNMTSTEWGGALSTFGQDYGYDGNAMDKIFAFPTIGISMFDAVDLLKIPAPDFIKMDVDGIEHLILKGGLPLLKKIKGILIEINDSFEQQAENASVYLKQAGLSFLNKQHAKEFDTGMSKSIFNQIWFR